ncbi:MAG: hypothetical protein V2I97_02745 [Desulfococcaceae bacterium]|jgi:hypothetical protein|nr:hypothetical protein [Desulfococcaceae bacterium]
MQDQQTGKFSPDTVLRLPRKFSDLLRIYNHQQKVKNIPKNRSPEICQTEKVSRIPSESGEINRQETINESE